MDRIVPVIRAMKWLNWKKSGYHDGFLDTAEHFYMIEGPKSLATELHLNDPLFNVLIFKYEPYKERKVAILDGAHTALVPVAFQGGATIPSEKPDGTDVEICALVEELCPEEIIPVLDLPRDELDLSPVQSRRDSVTRT
ncbi:hypothetical protein ACLK1U_08840 [Escherichia coli]